MQALKLVFSKTGTYTASYIKAVVRQRCSDADPDPACHFDADADPDPAFHFNADLPNKVSKL
jgi:hypothetical protein